MFMPPKSPKLFSRPKYWAAEFKGRAPLSENFGLLYEAEYATQSNYGDNPNPVDTNKIWVFTSYSI